MARITSKKVDTKDLQGEGSFVEYKPVSWKTAKAARYFLSVGDVTNRIDMSDAEKQRHTEEETKLTEECLFGSIIAWNWADENNKPLPVPRTVEDLDLLTSEEVNFLLSLTTQAPQADLKNSGSGS
jgi:hypothetical protein